MKDGLFRLEGRPSFVYSGEIHYFRIPRKEWRSRLRQMKKCGFNTASTYVPWIYHEPEEGRIDLTGKTEPERDFFGFLRAAREEGLSVIPRIGPVSNAELVSEGIPPWLLKNYPDVSVQGRRDVGNLPHVTLISYLHPTFQKFVTRWYDCILPSLADCQIGRKGSVIAVQLCNEIAMVHWLQKAADHRGHVTALYRAFLKERYGSIRRLNEAWAGAAYSDFSEVDQPSGENVALSSYAMNVDWALFYRRYYATYYLSLSARVRQSGVRVPLLCNIPQFYDYDIRGRGNYAPMTTSMFQDFALLTPGVVFGGAYQTRHIDFENFHDLSLTTEITRMLSAAVPSKSLPEKWRTEGTPTLPRLPDYQVHPEGQNAVLCAELQTGIMRDRPRLYPHQVELLLKTSVGQGLAGVNGYMVCGGANKKGLGAFGTYHDWQSPIGPKGEERPHLEPLREFGKFLEWADAPLAATKKVCDTTIGFYLPYYATEYMSGNWIERLESKRTYLWYDGLARLIHLAGFSPNYCDLQRTPLDVLQGYPHIWVYSLEFMDRETQEKLAAYVRNGGKLILYPNVPTMDLNGRPESALARSLKIQAGGEIKGNIFSDGSKEYWIQGPFQSLTDMDAKAPFIRSPGGQSVAVLKSVGTGTVLAVGFGMPHVFDHYVDWIRDWTGRMGFQPLLSSDPRDVIVTLRRAEDYGFLFVYNYHFTPRTARVGIGKGVLGGERKVEVHLDPLSAKILPVNVPLAGDVRVVSSTEEISGVRVTSTGVTLRFANRPAARLRFSLTLGSKPRSVKVQNKSVPFSWTRNTAGVVCEAPCDQTQVQLIY